MQRILFVLDKLYDFFFFFSASISLAAMPVSLISVEILDLCSLLNPHAGTPAFLFFQVRFQAYIPARISIEPFECMSGLFFCDRMTFSLIIPLFFPMLSRDGDVPAVFLTLSQALSVCVPESTCCSTLVLASRDHF